LITIGGLENVDIVVTDRRPSDPWVEHLRQLNIRLVHA